jgi:hypothetical protein
VAQRAVEEDIRIGLPLGAFRPGMASGDDQCSKVLPTGDQMERESLAGTLSAAGGPTMARAGSYAAGSSWWANSFALPFGLGGSA